MKALNLLKATIQNSLLLDTAFIFNNWTNLLSALAYTVTYVLWVDIIFQNTPTMAGYSRDEMLFFSLIAQICFYLVVGLLFPNIAKFISDVNSGHFDFLLIKPVPGLFYTLTRKLNILAMVRDAVVPLGFMIYMIDFNNLTIQLHNLVFGSIILVLGILVNYLVGFICALPVFWLGESSGIFTLYTFINFDIADDIPYEGFTKFPAVQIILTYILPLLISTGLATSVILGKTDWLLGLIITTGITIAVLIMINILWQISLKNYSSASS